MFGFYVKMSLVGQLGYSKKIERHHLLNTRPSQRRSKASVEGLTVVQAAMLEDALDRSSPPLSRVSTGLDVAATNYVFLMLSQRVFSA